MELAGCLSLKDLVSTKKSKVDSSIDGRSSQKENMYDRFRISPRAPFKSEPIDLSKQKAFTPDRIPITPVKVMEPPQTDPLTPTANLKMLISVASPEIRDWEKKKELFRPIENNEQDDAAPCSQQFDAVDDMDELEKRPSRKQKSLGLLCQKFLARYPSYPMSTEKTTISLDEAAASLGVERRRIYDIVNVLESLNLVSRVAKNQYCWHGQHSLNETLKGLQQLGESHKYEDQIAYFQHKELYNEPKCQERRKEFLVDSQNISLLELPDADGPSATTSSRKDKSLRIMSQKFVMLFLASSTKIITLEIAAKILIEEGQDAADYSKFKTKVRRLYDIANVLTSLGLIKKVHVTEERGRKPAFKWIGPADFKASEDQRMPVTTNTQSSDYKREVGILLVTDVNRKDRMSRHSSFNMVQTSKTAKRKVCSEPSSPCKVQNVGTGSSDVYSSKMAHLAAVCQQKIEEDSKRQNSSPENTLEKISPFPVMVPVDSEYSCTSIADQGSNLLQKAINGQFVSVPSPVSSTEQNQHGFLPNQPYVYVPSSVFMLYGKLGEENMLRVEKENSNRQTPERPDPAFPASVVKYTPCPSENDRSKRQRIDLVDAPPSLMQQMEIIQSTNAGSPQEMNWETTIAPKSVSPCRDEETNVISKAVCPEDAGTARISHVGKPVPEEGVQPAPLPPYLYLTSAAGLNGFNFFLPANQAAGALGLSPSQLASLNVPCMVVPSSSVAGLPFICSPAVANRQASAPAGSSPSHIGMNFNLPRMAPATPLFIGASPVMATKISELSQDLLPSVSSEYESPVQRVVGSTSVKGDSAVCASQPATVVKSQKLTTPLTPKSIRPAQKETFFKTPSGVGVPSYFRKSEGTHYSSAQRRLEISSSSSD